MARALLEVSALCSLSAFDAVGWKDIRPTSGTSGIRKPRRSG